MLGGTDRGSGGAVGAGVPAVADHIDAPAGTGFGDHRDQASGEGLFGLFGGCRAGFRGPQRESDGQRERPVEQRQLDDDRGDDPAVSPPRPAVAVLGFRCGVMMPAGVGDPTPRTGEQGVIDRDQQRRVHRDQGPHDHGQKHHRHLIH